MDATRQATKATASEQQERRNPHAELIELASRCTSVQSFYSGLLGVIGRALGSPYATVYARLPAQVVQEEWHSGQTDPRFWKSGVQSYLTTALAEGTARAKLLSAKGSKLRVGVFAAPLYNTEGNSIGALALVAPVSKRGAQTQLALVESLVSIAGHLSGLVGRPQQTSASSAGAPNQALSRSAGYESPQELAFSLTNNLRNKLGCGYVSLGLVERKRIRILSISGLDDVRKDSPGIQPMRAAMEECLDLGDIIAHQTDGGFSGEGVATGHRLHMQWHEAARNAAVASIPLKAGEDIVAILSLRRAASEPFTRDELAKVREVVEPFAGALLLVKQARRSLVRHMTDTTRGAIGAVVTPGRLGVKIITAAVVLFALWFGFGTMSYDLTVPCVAVPAQVRHLTAPFDAKLDSANVIAGDHVRAGDILCELDHGELDLQREELLAELAVLEQDMQRARAEDLPTEVRLAEANRRLTQTKLDIIEQRIKRAVVRAPVDGVVVAGDLRQYIGGVLRQGDPLFEIAPLDEWTLELEIPESASSDLRVGLTGHFASQARPEESEPFELRRVRPQAEVRNMTNVYVAEARADISAEWMRPGMEGMARVQVGQRPVWWLAVHKITEYLHLNFWL